MWWEKAFSYFRTLGLMEEAWSLHSAREPILMVGNFLV